jgi:protease I
MLKGKKIAAIVTDGYHNTELSDPVNAFEKHGAEVTVLGVKAEHLTEGLLDHMSLKAPEKLPPEKRIKAKKLVYDVKSSDFDGLLIPGGYSPEELRNFPEAVAFAKDMYDSGKPLMAICHGSLLLIAAEVVSGKNMTCVSTISIDLKNAGAIFVDRPLVVDRNIVTSRTPKDMDSFIRGCIEILSK